MKKLSTEGPGDSVNKHCTLKKVSLLVLWAYMCTVHPWQDASGANGSNGTESGSRFLTQEAGAPGRITKRCNYSNVTYSLVNSL